MTAISCYSLYLCIHILRGRCRTICASATGHLKLSLDIYTMTSELRYRVRVAGSGSFPSLFLLRHFSLSWGLTSVGLCPVYRDDAFSLADSADPPVGVIFAEYFDDVARLK